MYHTFRSWVGEWINRSPQGCYCSCMATFHTAATPADIVLDRPHGKVVSGTGYGGLLADSSCLCAPRSAPDGMAVGGYYTLRRFRRFWTLVGLTLCPQIN